MGARTWPAWARFWVDGNFYLTSGAGTQKSLNLAANPSCVLSMALPGLDLVVEGRAAKVTDQATLERLAQRYAAQGWPARTSDGPLTAEFSAPRAGPPPWHLYVVTPLVAFGVASEKPYGATRLALLTGTNHEGVVKRWAVELKAVTASTGYALQHRPLPPDRPVRGTGREHKFVE
jgi:hypothetical protein